MPTIAWGVPASDLPRVKALGFNVVLKRFVAGTNPTAYLNSAAASGLKVLAWFPGTYALGTSNPSALDPWVAEVKSHPALYGYVSVIEPGASNLHIPLTVLKSLYSHLKALDPSHPVIVSYGHLPWFGADTNPFGARVADAIIAEWYPVVFPTLAYPTGWVSSTSTVLRNVRAVVAAKAPGTPIWLTVQMHEYLPSNKRQPSFAEVNRQIERGVADLGASGFAFYPWHTSTNYTGDLAGNAELQDSVRTSIQWLRDGKFDR
jgi:hypothetical protein